MEELSVCNTCGGPQRSDRTIVFDPRYRGPEGHSIPGQCYDCHARAWEDGLGWLAVILGMTSKQFLRTPASDPERCKN